ncbi:ferric reductase-like transmembrane domain-containing protein [Pseudonocardia acaciae]|uniref:ferric reductase-like transmembrane domain-containing protein n=1 Tax=Pseudonocardia acaciae TaxID=551276 RepID=UPI00048C0348|nr:ferric reductase-like transmembrane domain-containing protein [Pseudonocardia acaciae]
MNQRGGRHGFDRVGLLKDLRGGLLDGGLAVAVTSVVFGWLYIRVRAGTSPTIAVMPFLADADTYRLYWLCQAFGWSALLWSWLTVVLGLLVSGGGPRRLPVAGARLERWHRATSLNALVLMFAHAFLFFAEEARDNQENLGWPGRLGAAFVKAFVPGGYASGTGAVAILIGLVAFYLAIPLGLAFYLRRRIGTKAWRVLHRFVIVIYALSVWHTLLYGTNVWYDGPFRTLVWLLQVPIAVLLLARMVAPARASERLPTTGRLAWVAARAAVAATIVALVAVVVTGRDGGRIPGAVSAPLNTTAEMVWGGLALLLLLMAAAVRGARS